MRTIAVIPARYRSTRFPGKVLADISGKPMVEHVYRAVAKARGVDRVLVATDDPRVRDAVLSFGGESVLTSPDHPSGTDRVAEASRELDCDLVVNVQADEPLLAPEAVERAVAACRETEGNAIATLRTPITRPEELESPNVVKVVVDERGFALYFSRWPIPFVASADMRPENGVAALRAHAASGAAAPHSFFKHLGLYVYPKRVLDELSRTPPCRLELLEKLEQLRALERGIPIRVVETPYDGIGVDAPEDLERVKRILARSARAGDVALGQDRGIKG